MAGETDGKPQDPAGRDAAEGAEDRTSRASGRRGRAAGRREPQTIELRAETLAEAASTAVPEDPAVAAVERAAPPPGPAQPVEDLPPDVRPFGLPEGSPAEAAAEAAAATPAGPGPASETATPLQDVPVAPAGETAPPAAVTAAEERPAAGDEPPASSAPPFDRQGESLAAPAGREPPPSAAVPPPPVAARGAGRGTALALGLLGGVLGAGLVTIVMTLVGPGADTPDRLVALEAAVGDKASRRVTDALDKRAQAAEAALQGLRGDLSGLAGRPQVAPGDVTMLGQRVDRLDRAIAQLAARPAQGDAQAQAPVPLPPVVVAGRESAALAVAMLLRDAVSRGTPFARELAALEAGGGDPALVAQLKPFAAGGAPQAPALAAAFAPLAAQLARTPDPGASAGVVDRVTALIGGAVRIRPVGEPAGEKPGAVGARAETALRRGDLAAALKDLETLPAESRAPVQPFVDRLRARVAAGQAADTLVAAAVEQVIAATASSGVPTR